MGLYCMVLADGIVAAPELEMLYRIGIEQYGVRPEEINEALIERGSSFVVPDSLEERLLLIYNLSRIAWADGELDDSEKSLLTKYVLRMGFEKDNVDFIVKYMLDSVESGKSFEKVLEEILSDC